MPPDELDKTERDLRHRIENELDSIRSSARSEYRYALEEPGEMPPIVNGEVVHEYSNGLEGREFILYVLGRHDGLQEAAQRIEKSLVGKPRPASDSSESVDSDDDQ